MAMREVCMLLLSRVQLMLGPCVLTILDFNHVQMALVCMQLMRLSHAVSCASPLCGAVPAA
eukprot:1146935-Pelagomonas_calceolata.AAC.2